MVMVRARRTTIQELSTETNLDPEDVLLLLWEAGFDDVRNVNSRIPASKVKQARVAVAAPSISQLRSPSYWMSVLQLEPKQFADLLDSLGIEISATAKKLPSSSIRKLKRHASNLGHKDMRNISVQPVRRITSRAAPLVWDNIGRFRELRYLSENEVLAIHGALVADFANDSDPIEPAGPRDKNLLASAVFRPQTRVGDTLKYPTVEMAGAALLHSLVHNHPFHNGNKRTGLVSALVFLDENSLITTCDEEELFKFVLRIARHGLVEANSTELADRELLAMAQWINDNARTMELGERPLPFRKLRRILSRYDCTLEYARSGSKINICRTVVARMGILRRPQNTSLQTQVYYGGEGKEVERNTINKIRADLQLNEEHCVDSSAFYDSEPTSIDDFILRYRKTLRRLSRL
ncbi:MAG: hypothetical protein CEE38_10225 [Planctomycetes bacterium B3_Pla]|nr:MAG: hypothetical protein CEE38_10225 [Planctomycetes bacterium B3_Pla]